MVRGPAKNAVSMSRQSIGKTPQVSPSGLLTNVRCKKHYFDDLAFIPCFSPSCLRGEKSPRPNPVNPVHPVKKTSEFPPRLGVQKLLKNLQKKAPPTP